MNLIDHNQPVGFGVVWKRKLNPNPRKRRQLFGVKLFQDEQEAKQFALSHLSAQPGDYYIVGPPDPVSSSYTKRDSRFIVFRLGDLRSLVSGYFNMEAQDRGMVLSLLRKKYNDAFIGDEHMKKIASMNEFQLSVFMARENPFRSDEEQPAEVATTTDK